MQSSESIIQLLISLWRHISSRRRIQFGLLLLLMLVTSFAEVLSIGAVLPFLAVLTSPNIVFEHPIAQPLISTLGLISPEQLILPLTFLFGLMVLIAGLMRLLLLWASTRLSFATGADLSVRVYHRTLYQPYTIHCARNSSEVISGIWSKTGGAANVMNQTLNIISAAIMLTGILVALLSVNPVIAMGAFGGFGLIYAAIICITRERLLSNSQRISKESSNVIKALQEGLGGIRDVLINGSQTAYCKIYRNADLPMRRAQANTIFIGSSPRFGMEALGMMLIAFLAYILSQQPDGLAKAIPILGALALGAQRLLPVLQQAYSAWTIIRGDQASLKDVIELLEQPLPSYAEYPVAVPLPFKKEIVLKQLAFRYNLQTPYVLKNVNLIIPKGSRIGFIGETGSGKSTLLDIVMGLLQPTNGLVKVDGLAVTIENNHHWQAHISHVPQAIFLADSTIEENIAFGVPKDEIDVERVRLAAHQAQVADSIEKWPEQYQTNVGEHGIRLSGGQRQRIGIARALYRQADVIIFDEATSALDAETEQAVMQAIEGLSKHLTLLIIAHRLTTLKNCNQIVKLADGEIKRIGSYQEIIK